MLFDRTGHVSGVVDWNFGVARGDRRFALIKTRFELAWCRLNPAADQHHVQPSAIDQLDQILDTQIEPHLLQLYWAHWSLYQLDWTIRHEPTDAINLHLDLAESRLDT